MASALMYRRVRKATREYVDRMSKETGWRPDKVGLFAGAVKYSQYDGLTRFSSKLVVAVTTGDTNTSRDYEYTNWNNVKRFAADFAASVVP